MLQMDKSQTELEIAMATIEKLLADKERMVSDLRGAIEIIEHWRNLSIKLQGDIT